MDESIAQKGSIEKFPRSFIMLHWLLLIIAFILLVTGAIPFINWFMHEMHIYEIVLDKVPYSSEVHKITGIIFALMVVNYIKTVFQNDRENLQIDTQMDIPSFYNSVFYIIGISRRKEFGKNNKYQGSQRVLFLLYIFSIGLLIFSGIILILNGQANPNGGYNEITGTIFMLHIFSVIMLIVLVLYQFGMILRNLDLVALKSILVTGKVPLWYIKKNHIEWYKNIMGDEEKQKSS